MLGFYWILMRSNPFFHDLIEFYWVLFGCSKLEWAGAGFDRVYWILLGFTWARFTFHCVL